MKCLWKLAPADIRFATSQLTSQLRTSSDLTYFSTLVELKAFSARKADSKGIKYRQIIETGLFQGFHVV